MLILFGSFLGGFRLFLSVKFNNVMVMFEVLREEDRRRL